MRRLPGRPHSSHRPADASDASQPHDRAAAAGRSLLGALVIAARHRGIHLGETQLRRDHRIGADGPSCDELLQIVRATGMRAVATRLSFQQLMRLATALPAIPVLKNGNAMVLLRVEPAAPVPHVVLEDPAAGDDALLRLDEQRLALGWDGEVILVKRDYRLRDEDQPFGLGLIIAQLCATAASPATWPSRPCR